MKKLSVFENEVKYQCNRFRENTPKVKELIKKPKYCKFCQKKRKLELDHIIPVSIGGDMFDINNLQTLCFLCHRKKSEFDRFFVHFMKKLRWCNGKNQKWSYFVEKDFIIKLYKDIYSKDKELIR